MSEDYLFECQRAELLGQSPPTEEEWREKFLNNVHNDDDDDDDDDDDKDNNADAENLEQSDESMKRIGGGLDELTSILSATQKKINRFKTVCGSLGSLLKVKVNSRTATPEHSQSSTANNEDNPNHADNEETEETLTIETEETCSSEKNDKKNPVTSGKKIDLNEKMGSHLDKLDSLITKAENAQYSMQHQTKQMKKIIKK